MCRIETFNNSILFHERAQTRCHHQPPDPPLIDFKLSGVEFFDLMAS